MLPVEVYLAACSALLGVLGNWLKVKWVAVLLVVVGVGLYLWMVVPNLSSDHSGIWRTLFISAFYWAGPYLALFALPFLSGFFLYRAGRALTLRMIGPK